MIAATMTTIWGLGFTGWADITFDPLVLVIPMIITARATSHTVQMAERFFEDYEVMLPRYPRPEDRAHRGRHHRDGRAGGAGHARHRHRRGRADGDHGDLDPADARPRHLRLVLGVLDHHHRRDPAPDPDLLPAGADRARALPAGLHGARHALHRLAHHPPEAGSTRSAATTVALFVSCTYIALFHSTDRRGQSGHAALVAGPRIQRRDQDDRPEVRRRGFADGLLGRRSPERQRRRRSDQGDGALRARAQDRHEPRRVDLRRAVPAHLLAGEPLRRSEVVLRAGPPGHRARRDLPATAERRAWLHAAVHDRRRAQGQHPVLLPRPQGRHGRLRHALRRGVHQEESARRGDHPARRGPGRSEGQLLQQRAPARPLVLHARPAAARPGTTRSRCRSARRTAATSMRRSSRCPRTACPTGSTSSATPRSRTSSTSATRSRKASSSPGRRPSRSGTAATSTSGGRARTSACAPWRRRPRT